MRKVVGNGIFDPDIQEYIVQMLPQKQKPQNIDHRFNLYGSFALLKLSRAWAVVYYPDFGIPEDGKILGPDGISHRMVRQPDGWGSIKTKIKIIFDVIQSSPVHLNPVRV